MYQNDDEQFRVATVKEIHKKHTLVVLKDSCNWTTLLTVCLNFFSVGDDGYFRVMDLFSVTAWLARVSFL